MTNKIAFSLKLSSKIKYKNAKTDNNGFGLNTWYKNHRLACNDSVKTLSQAPISNLFTMLILGIALALPVLLYLVILNIGGSLNTWQQSFYQYSIYLDNNYTEQQAVNIKNSLEAWPEVNKVNIITKEQGMAELKMVMGIENVVGNVQDNPLPIVLVVNLKDKYKDLKNIKTLIGKSKTVSGVVKVDADIIWLEKIASVLNIVSKIIVAFFIILGIAILLVIANTIRLILENKQQEMTLCSLLGATMAYIRRPYLYGGVCYGLFAGLIAYLVAITLFNKLYNLLDDLGYSKLLNAEIVTLAFNDFLILLFFSGLLGWVGARIALYFQCKKLKSKLSEI